MPPKSSSYRILVWALVFGFFNISSVMSLELKFCAEDQNQSPYIVGNSSAIMEDLPGLVVEMVQLAGTRLKAKTVFLRAPWKRCLLLLERGAVDGVFLGSYSTAREEIAVFPMIGGKIDPSRRIITSSYSFYRLKGATLDWDGESFIGIWGDVGAPRGYSIVKDLRARGRKVREYDSPVDVFYSLIRREIASAAVHTSAGDLLIESKLFPAIERIQAPIVTKHYYIMLSHSLFEQNRALAENFWKELATIRENEAKQMIKKYLK
ncbi:MAG: transporter substrate-binding domain-containing protein [Sneathiella sp.]